ncbi:Ger(x)C family spore germination protein [Paenibacillus sp. MMS20-IR301]|uniref:Ger(x)C family spore germination protein n=1 Tax=Paenibacillus sp. MMS20-IR301 TaxID=2895946 RepID=UPI0028EBEA13|nr:Ger(x)C family spore germination protein [Paenibacillus sp. MMS20-IR301]WNS43902.1 Ger(x)C family spore germination protein [Paenibacillus sp. MMS20-IR301]
MSSKSVRKRGILLVLLLTVQAQVLTGCWSRIEINDRLLVVALFIDQTENDRIQMTLGYAKPNQISSQSGGESPSQAAPYSTISGEGKNLSDAYRNIQTNISREIFWGQVKIIVVGERYARHGVERVFDFVNRKSSIPLKTYMLVAEGKARDVADFPTQIEKFPSEIFRELVTRKKIITGSVKHFLIAQEYGKGMILAFVGSNPDKKLGNQIKVLGAALFQDNVLKETMDIYKTRGAMWLRGNIKDAIITFNSPTDGELISCLVIEAKSKIIPHIKDDEIIFTQKLDIESVIDSSNSAIDYTDPEMMKRLEMLLSEEIAERIQLAFSTTRTAGADAFQFGSYIAWYYPKEWQRMNGDWSSIYKERVKLIVETKSVIRLLGAEKNSKG